MSNFDDFKKLIVLSIISYKISNFDKMNVYWTLFKIKPIQ